MMNQVNQSRLLDVLHNIFSGKEILHNTRKANLVSIKTGHLFELDCWIPDCKIGFEYQKAAIETRGDTLIVVPCWWDGTEESLIASIRQQRPDLLQSRKTTIPIPPDPPPDYFQVNKIPGIGELMLPSFEASPGSIDIGNWWMSEKYDGIRALWHPEYQQLYSKNGRVLDFGDLFYNSLPECFLDGEIWLGRGCFNEIVSMGSNNNVEHLRFLCFDSPDYSHSDQPYRERYNLVLDSLLGDFVNLFMEIVPMIQCNGREHMMQYSAMVIGDTGEGSILRNPTSVYEYGRSDSLIKYKVCRDQEALVVEADNSSGEHVFQMANGITFKQKLDKNIENGRVVTFSYDGYKRETGEPRRPHNFIVRPDLLWFDILYSFFNDSHLSIPLISEPSTSASSGYWTQDEGKNIRNFFQEFADNKKFNPLIPDSWYPITCKEIISYKGGSVLMHFGGSLANSLISVFPNIGLDSSKFSNTTRNYWKNEGNRRTFFDEFASKYKFDTNVADNWYSVNRQDVLREKSAAGVLRYYDNSVENAIISLYPSLQLQLQKFQMYSGKKGSRRYNQSARYYFDKLAKIYGFDPLLPDNWYSLNPEVIKSNLLTKPIVSQEGGYGKSLLAAYPDIGFKIERKTHSRFVSIR